MYYENKNLFFLLKKTSTFCEANAVKDGSIVCDVCMTCSNPFVCSVMGAVCPLHPTAQPLLSLDCRAE